MTRHSAQHCGNMRVRDCGIAREVERLTYVANTSSGPARGPCALKHYRYVTPRLPPPPVTRDDTHYEINEIP